MAQQKIRLVSTSRIFYPLRKQWYIISPFGAVYHPHLCGISPTRQASCISSPPWGCISSALVRYITNSPSELYIITPSGAVYHPHLCGISPTRQASCISSAPWGCISSALVRYITCISSPQAFELKKHCHIKRQMHNAVFYHEIFFVENIRFAYRSRKAASVLIERGMETVIAGLHFNRRNFLAFLD